MIGQIVTDETGNPIDGNGNALSPSAYQPSDEVKELFARVQTDYQTAYALQHRGFDEFDGYSLLDRARMDQETFGAFVGAEYVPVHKKWRWKGRKNTARNKLIGILAHMLAAMLFPYVHATNDEDEEDKAAARVMAILIENHLRAAGYEMQFLYIVLSALVNPAVIVQVQYVQAMQKVKQRMADGSVKILDAVDEILSGLSLNIVPIDELLIADFFTNDIQKQPFNIRVRRIPYDQARAVDGDNPNFKYVHAGATRMMLTGQENQTLYDIEWTEADSNYVQEVTFYYRSEDLEVRWVGGVFMGNETDVYNTNPFKHRRMTQIDGEWASVPIYEYAKSGFEPIDPTGRFFYYKSGAFKEYWDDQALNHMQRMFLDGTSLDVFKPIFGSGVAKMDTTVIAPGAFVGMPPNASVTPYALGSNLTAAYNAIVAQKEDMSDSTQDSIQNGVTTPGVTARATVIAQQNARIFLGVFGIMVADLVTKIGELSMDCIIEHTTVGEIDATVPEAIAMKFKTVTARGKEKGKNVTNRIVFSSEYMGRDLDDKEIREEEWKLYEKEGGHETDQRIYMVNPYQFARTKYTMWVDADQILSKSMGTEQQTDALALQTLTNPLVAPYVDMEAVVHDFAIEPFANGDPDRYTKKGNVNDLMQGVMGQQPGGQPAAPGAQASPLPNQPLGALG